MTLFAMVIEQGLSFTLVEAPHPLEDDDPEGMAYRSSPRSLYFARRVWLGYVPGTDWLHDEIERHFGEDNVWYEVRSGRDAAHVGAAAEVATVVVLLMGAAAIKFAATFVGTLGERAASDIYDWVRNLARERRRERGLEHADAPPDFTQGWDMARLGEGMKSELADILRMPVSELEVVGLESREGLALFATYRLTATGDEYTAEVGSDYVDFRRVGAQPPVPDPVERCVTRRPFRAPTWWRRRT